MGVRRTAWLLAALVVGVVIACDPGGWSPFGPAKWLVVSAVGVALVGTAVSGVVRLDRRERLVLGGFLALVVLSAVVGVDGRYAWLGTPSSPPRTADLLLPGSRFRASGRGSCCQAVSGEPAAAA